MLTSLVKGKNLKITFFFLLISLSGISQKIYDFDRDLKDDSIAYSIQDRLNNKDTLGNDFVETWDQIGSEHKEKIRQQLLSMSEKNYSFALVGKYIFMLNLGVIRERIDYQNLTDLLNVHQTVLDKNTGEEANKFYHSLITFFIHRGFHNERAHQWLVHNDTYRFEYKQQYISEVTPSEPMEEEDTWDEPVEQEINWDEEEEDPWKEEEETWEEWDTGFEEEEQLYEDQDDMLYAMGAVSSIPEVVGPAIVFQNLDLNLVTSRDSVFIKDTSGDFDLLNNLFIGEGGTFSWTPAGLEGVYATLGAYSIDPTSPLLRAEDARLYYPERLEEEIAGILEYKSVKRDTSVSNPYPRFMSYYNNINVRGLSEDVEYRGGFTLKGQKISSASVMGGLSRIILKNEGNIKAKSFSDLYVLEDSVVYSDMGSVILYHGYDSIHHPAIRIRFEPYKDQLTIQEAKNGFRNTPYSSSYFSLNFQADMVKWDLNQDSLNIQILQGRKIVPAKFESIHHFHEEDYRSLGDKMYDFNPLGIVAYYSKEYKTDEFYVSDLAAHYKKDENLLHGAMVMLMQKGLIKYNTQTRLIEVKDKAKHLYQSRYQLTDYDNIIITSVSEKEPNATMDFEKGYIRIRGVQDFLVSDSLFVKIVPDSAEILMYKNRNFNFDGKVTAGNFEYIGRNFAFSYDSFLIRLRTIDSVKFYIQEENSRGQNYRKKMDNALVGLDSTTATSAGLIGFANRTSGTLYINTPGNKSGAKNVPNYPKFAAGEGAVVYFDSKNILDGVYERDIYFVIPPFDIDSLNDSDPASIGFDGIFVSNGMLPNFEERLHYVGNDAMGFDHTIREEGYQLYKGRGLLYGELELSHRGLYNKGRVEFRSTIFYSDEIFLHPDSLVASGTTASMLEFDSTGVSYPQATLNNFNVTWVPRRDEMRFSSGDDPFTLYNGEATFNGDLIVKTDGAYGNGKVQLKGSNTISKTMKFEDNRFLARHADFEVETDNPHKPALAGDDVRVLFNLENNYAEISPEIEGQAAIEFPYAQFKTSITNARWDLNEGTITMSKPEDVPLSSSYFYTTREDLDSLAFNATKAVYDIQSQEMTVSGIPYIKVADAMITPENNEVLILENSRIGQLTNTTIVLDTNYHYHKLTDGVIDIISRNEFSGYANYQYVNGSKDTFSIRMENFRLERIIEEGARKNDEGSLHTVANGSVTAMDNLVISPGMVYKGDMILYAHKPAMELDGYVKLDFQTIPGYDTWIQYASSANQQEVIIPFSEAITEDGRKIEAGLLFNMFDNRVYPVFVGEKEGLDDEYFFKPSGLLRYRQELGSYVIEDTAKTSGNSYQGKFFSFNESTGGIQFEGPVSFLKNNKDVEVTASVIGKGDFKQEEYSMNSLLTFSFNIPSSAYDIMAQDIIDVVTNLGAPEGRGDHTQLLYKLGNLMGERATREFENASLQNYVPLGQFSGEVSKPMVFADVDLHWSPEYKGFYSKGMLGMSNINKHEVNAAFEGFMEIKKNESGGPVVNIFIKASAASWYYFGLEENRLLIHSSNDEFNKYITGKSNASKAKIDDLVFIPGSDAEVLDFINRYRFEYFGINDPYILNSTSEVVEEQLQETAPAEEEDDGFEDDGF